MPLIKEINDAINRGDIVEFTKLIQDASREQLEQYEPLDFSKLTPMDCASQVGNSAALQLLLAKGLDPNTRNKKDGYAALHNILLINNKELRHENLDIIISSGADINLTVNDSARNSALHLCITRSHMSGYIETIKKLLNFDGLNINCKNGGEQTALDLAEDKADVKYLLQQMGAAKSSAYIQPLIINRAFRYNWQYRSVYTYHGLTTAGDVMQKPENLITTAYLPCREAAQIENIETGETVFHLAIKTRQTEKIVAFSDGKAFPFIQDKACNTVFHTAAAAGNVNALQILFDNYSGKPFNPFPAHYELKNKQGNSCLHLAVQANSMPCILFLVDKGCNIEVANAEGKTPVQLVKENQDLLAQLLKSPLGEKLKMILEGKTATYAKLNRLFVPAAAQKKQTDADIEYQLSTLQPVTQVTLKKGVVTKTATLLLERQSTVVLERYLSSLPSADECEGLKRLRNEVSEIIESRKNPNNSIPTL